MKPIKLIISAIGPYAGEVPTIEFAAFGERHYMEPPAVHTEIRKI